MDQRPVYKFNWSEEIRITWKNLVWNCWKYWTDSQRDTDVVYAQNHIFNVRILKFWHFLPFLFSLNTNIAVNNQHRQSTFSLNCIYIYITISLLLRLQQHSKYLHFLSKDCIFSLFLTCFFRQKCFLIARDNTEQIDNQVTKVVIKVTHRAQRGSKPSEVTAGVPREKRQWAE